MAKRNAISYIKNDEPAFIKQLKSRVGYKEGPDIDTKRQKLDYEEEDRSDEEDEKPVIVVIKKGDLTEEEAKEEDTQQKKIIEEELIREGKITFKKPVKKADKSTNEETSELEPNPPKEKERSKQKNEKHRQKKKSNLLSFGDEEENEDQ